jgi:hypothetical protein
MTNGNSDFQKERKSRISNKEYPMTVVPILATDAKLYNVFTPKGLNIIAQGKRSAALG